MVKVAFAQTGVDLLSPNVNEIEALRDRDAAQERGDVQ
jgi:hypothetical protein